MIGYLISRFLRKKIRLVCIAQRSLLLTFLCFLPVAHGAAPPANTKIINQATATYFDSINVQRSVTSNAVVSNVSQVGAMTFSAGTSLGGTTGSTVYAPHTLVNTGNGSDTFNISVSDNRTLASFAGIAIYADPNGTGLPAANTAPLCSSLTTACTTAIKQTIAAGSAFRFVVAYSLPTTATSGSWPSDSAAVVATVDTSSPVLSSYSPSTLTSTDTVTFSGAASFGVNTVIGLPSVNAPGKVAWSVSALNSGNASSDPSCTTTYSTTLSSTPSCTYTVFTINYNNNGASSGILSIVDALPSGLTYVTGSTVWSNNPGVALNDAGTGNPTGITFSATTNGLMNIQIADVGSNVSGSVSFIALVNTAATFGGTNANNFASYSPSTCTGTATSCATIATNTAVFVVKQKFGVVVANVKSLISDTANGAAGAPNKSGIDLVSQASSAPGSVVTFTQFVTNTGNGTDNFSLSLSGSTFPAGTVFGLYQSDGQTLINSSVSGYQYTTGPIAPGTANSFTVIVKATIPTNAVATSTPSFVLLTATSTGAASAGAAVVPDAVWDQLQTITGALLDLKNSAAGTPCSSSPTTCDIGPGPSTAPTVVQSTPAGTTTSFSLWVTNNDTITNSYNVSYSNTSSFPGALPSGWTVTFMASGNCDTGTPLSAPLIVAAGGQASLLACVTPPLNAAVGTQNIYFRAQAVKPSSSGTLLSDVLFDAINVTAVKTFTLNLSPTTSNGQASAGASYVYPHTLTNTGSQPCGSTGGFNISAQLSAADVAAGWSASVYVDTDNVGVINKNSVLITSNGQLGAIAPGSNVRLLIKVFVPGGIALGASDTLILTITDNTPAPNTCPAQSATDVTTVVSSSIAMIKYQVLDSTCSATAVPIQGSAGLAQVNVVPGGCINYLIIVTNQGASNVTNLTINDIASAYTSIASIQPATPCSFSGSGSFTSTKTSTSMTCGGTNTLPPGGTAMMNFSVKVDN